jgi:hypothetical protein
MFHELKDPEVPPTRSIKTVNVVDEYEVTSPSMYFAVFAVAVKRTRCPTSHALPDCVVAVFVPVPSARLVVDVLP